ncbi:MAG: DNA polymerase III subunit chi [Proteobacteria bacterium]|nr:DNA polymerase III subunit chi [Pseudomonadota bacterium]MBK8958132.1 DNA polymerase III subunit chi [Pseudomonadota bacterium]
MTRVDFYVIEPPAAADHDRMMCRIVEKAWQQGHGVYVQCEDEARARAFDDLLWQFQDTSFVPHALAADAGADTRVVVGCAAVDNLQPDVLVNLAAAVPELASRYARVIESAGYDDATRGAARARYRYYQDRGFALNTHKVSR